MRGGSVCEFDRIDLVIFDCDGVLVDSELLANRVIVEMAGEFGLAMSLHESVELFRGCSMAECRAEIERRLMTKLPASFETTYRQRVHTLLRRELRAVDGVHEAIGLIDLPICVASNASMESLGVSLDVTGLAARFEGRMFSAYVIGKWKPDPALFLRAARTLGASPPCCVVVEDSVPGVCAAVAAGMRVLGYAPSPSHAANLRAYGAGTFSSMHELPALLDRLGQEEPSETASSVVHAE